MRLKIAIFTPLPPIKSGISDYSIDLATTLKEYCDIIFVIDNSAPNPKNSELNGINWERLNEFNTSKYRDYIRFYQMGNNIYHEFIFKELINGKPGITLLHDYSIHHLIDTLFVAKKDYLTYSNLMQEEYGKMGLNLALLREKGMYDQLCNFILPLNRKIIKYSSGIIVHSKESFDEIKYNYPKKKCIKIPFPVKKIDKKISDETLTKIKESFNLKSNHLIISTLGFATPTKQIPLILQALHKIKKDIPNFMFIIAGEVSNSLNLDYYIKKFNLENNVTITNYISLKKFEEIIMISDFIINLRYPSAGETSAVLFRAMQMGKPAIVYNYSSFSDLPEEGSFKIKLDTLKSYDLENAIKKLANDNKLRDNKSNFIKNFIFKEHSIDKVSSQICDFIGQEENNFNI